MILGHKIQMLFEIMAHWLAIGLFSLEKRGSSLPEPTRAMAQSTPIYIEFLNKKLDISTFFIRIMILDPI